MGKDNSKLAPQVLSDLTENTNFTEDEVRRWYKDFQDDFPEGELTIDQFKTVYMQHFPDGDATKFAEHVFRTFDKDHDRKLTFREFMTALSVTARGDSVDRLRWAFHMYDIDGNGFISKAECVEIIRAIYGCYGKNLPSDMAPVSPEEKCEEIFNDIDKNKDGRITFEEFIGCASGDDFLARSLNLSQKKY